MKIDLKHFRVKGVFQDIKMISGGNLNDVSNIMIDRCPPPTRSSIVNPEFNNLCLGLGLLDIWRSKYPDEKDFGASRVTQLLRALYCSASCVTRDSGFAPRLCRNRPRQIFGVLMNMFKV